MNFFRNLLRGFRKHEIIEVRWQEKIAAALREKGMACQTEARLDDQARVDMLMDYYAVEIDWANKWAESLGQALYYALRTSRKPAVLLLLEKDQHRVDVSRATVVARNNTPPIVVWTLDVRTGVLEMNGTKIQVA